MAYVESLANGDNKPHHGEKRSFSTLFFKRLQINYCFELFVVYGCALMCHPLFLRYIFTAYVVNEEHGKEDQIVQNHTRPGGY